MYLSNFYRVECVPPPLPPRRKIFLHDCAPVNLQVVSSTKTRKSSWNLKNVFGRKAAADTMKNAKQIEVVKSQTTSRISNLCPDCQKPENLLANGKNSFSTPDLTNIIAPSPTTPSSSSEPTKTVTDETDFDVMDIERSNSLNCSTNQFVSRPPQLNISDNILWSHNLSLTLSSTANSSAINLVGANVNGHDSVLGRDSLGYCKMAPILDKNDRFKLIRTSTTNFDDKPSELLNSSSIYCTMAPILRKTDQIIEPKVNLTVSEPDALKNITFERTFDLEEGRSTIFDCSMKSIANSSLSDITTSSGVSSDDGNIAAIMSMRCITPVNAVNNDEQNNDDAISLTYTESPPESAQSDVTENPFIFHVSKFDQKTPSYFPNEKTTTVPETTKYTVNTKSPKLYAKNGRKQTEPVTIPVPKENSHQTAIVHFNQLKNAKKQTCKGVLKTPTSSKVQKSKQRRGSVTENHMDQHSPSTFKNENWYYESGPRHTYQPTENYKYDTLPASFDSKNVLSHLNHNTKLEPNRSFSFEKNPKPSKIRSSPRRIYNKITLRLKTPPSTPNELTPEDCLNSSLDSAMRTNPELHLSTRSDNSRNGLVRSWARFRKIDFSPLKTRINSILQRPNNAEY